MGGGFKTAFIPMAAGVRAFSPETDAAPPPAGGGPGSGPSSGAGTGSGGVGGILPFIGALLALMLAFSPTLVGNSRREQRVEPQTSGAPRSVDFSYSGPAVLD